MTTRRDILTGLAALPLAATQAFADGQCTIPNMFGVRTCSVGVDVGAIETARQRLDHWCWAASISAAFSMHDHPVDQQRIVNKVFPYGNNNGGADGPHIIEAIDGTWTDDNGDNFSATGVVLVDTQYAVRSPFAIPIAAQQLVAGNGLIIGSEGHACVLTEMTYDLNVYNGAYALREMTVRDPWPGNSNKRIYRYDEAALMMFLCAVLVT